MGSSDNSLPISPALATLFLLPARTCSQLPFLSPKLTIPTRVPCISPPAPLVSRGWHGTCIRGPGTPGRPRLRRCCRDAARSVQQGLGQGLARAENVRAVDLPGSAELLSLLGELPPQKGTVSSAGGNPCPGSQAAAGRCACLHQHGRRLAGDSGCAVQRVLQAPHFPTCSKPSNGDGMEQDRMGQDGQAAQPQPGVLQRSRWSCAEQLCNISLEKEGAVCSKPRVPVQFCMLGPSLCLTDFNTPVFLGSVRAILALLRRSSHGHGSH